MCYTLRNGQKWEKRRNFVNAVYWNTINYLKKYLIFFGTLKSKKWWQWNSLSKYCNEIFIELPGSQVARQIAKKWTLKFSNWTVSNTNQEPKWEKMTPKSLENTSQLLVTTYQPHRNVIRTAGDLNNNVERMYAEPSVFYWFIHKSHRTVRR